MMGPPPLPRPPRPSSTSTTTHPSIDSPLLPQPHPTQVDAFSRLTLDIICDAGFGHVLGSAKRAATCVGENHQQMEPLLPAAAAAANTEEDQNEGDEIALAVRLGFEEVAKRLTDPLRILKYLPHRYRRTAFARRVLRRVIEKAVGERAAAVCMCVCVNVWAFLGGRDVLPCYFFHLFLSHVVGLFITHTYTHIYTHIML